MDPNRQRFHGHIAGLGSTSGVRIVLGHWRTTPMGSFSDVMLEQPDGHRLLLAPRQEVADFIADTYTFDEVRITPVRVTEGPGTTDGRPAGRWHVEVDGLTADFTVGRRLPLGALLRAVPRPLSRAPWWNAALDPVARRVVKGVRTRGTARSGRHEYYGATDQHRVLDLDGRWEGTPLGRLSDVDPPVRFGFSSTPVTPSLTRVVTTVVLDV